MTRLPLVAVLIAALIGGAPAVRGQPGPAPEAAAIRGESPQTRKRLAEADQKLRAGKPAEAVEELQRILDEAGDDLVSVDGRSHRPARFLAHQILAQLPADVLRSYRNRIDEPARKLLEAGKRDRTPQPLRQLLDRYFVSTPAAEALLLLGDLRFERGEYRAAEHLWRQLLPNADADLTHPDAQPNPAVRARVVLAVIFQGERDRAKAELAAFRAKFPTATGSFAGKTGPLAVTLQGFLDHPPPARVIQSVSSWPTYAGDPERSGCVRGAFPVHWPSRPTWTQTIPIDALGMVPPPAPKQPPFGSPVVADGKVYLTDGTRILTFDLNTGEPAVAFTPGRFSRLGVVPDPIAKPLLSCGTLTAAEGRLYARFGPPAVRAPLTPAPGAKTEESEIVCFTPSPASGNEAVPLRESWRVRPPALEGRGPGVWEGTPLVADGRLWVALARFEGGRVVHAIACYDPADPERAPERPAWMTEVCDSPLTLGSETRTRQELLTRAGRNVVLATHTGVVAAVDAATGRRAWAFQYPRSARRVIEANHSPEPAPTVAVGGRVFVAPADAERVFALDAETGQLLWESGPTEGAQLLGVTRNRLVFTTTGPVRGIRAVNVITGSHRDGDGWIQAATNGPLSYGRGFVTEDAIVWPSRHGLYFLHPDTGRPLTPPLHAPRAGRQEDLFGNVVSASGRLLVVTPSQVWCYTTDAPPPPPPPNAEPRTPFEARIDHAERELAHGNEDAARATLREIVNGDFPTAERAWAAARWLQLSPRLPNTPLPAEMRKPELCREWLLTAAGEFLTLGTLIDRHTGREPPRQGLRSALLPMASHAPAAPDLCPDAAIVRTLRLPPPAFPLQLLDGAISPQQHLFAVAGGNLLAVPLGREHTEPSSHAVPEAFTQAADLDQNSFVAVGPFAVAVYERDRVPVWVFRVPDTDPLPDPPGQHLIRTGERWPRPQLSSFVLAGGWLFARIGERHLIAFDLRAGRVGWVLGTHGRPRYEPLAFPTPTAFGSHLFAGGGQIVAQLSDGRRWTLRADTGQVWNDTTTAFTKTVAEGHGERTARAEWVQPPAEIAGHRIAFSDGPGTVRCVHAVTGRAKWVYRAGSETSLTGEPPQVRGWGDAAFVAVRRNYGVELDRLDAASGQSAWEDGPAFLNAARVDLSTADADSERLYLPIGNKVVALDQENGQPVWEAALPKTSAAWVVRAGQKVVIAYPKEAFPDDPMPAAVASFRRCPLPGRLPWLATTAYDAWTGRTVPVLLLDPETGQCVKTLSIPARGPLVTAQFVGETAAVTTGDRVAFLR